MKKILVTGGNGQLGSELRLLSANLNNLSFTFIDIEDLDLTRKDEVDTYFTQNQFDFIINCAAYTAVDKAEEEVSLAYKVNEEMAGCMAQKAKDQNATIIHVSTDFVFEGSLSRHLTETDEANPVSIYGKSKLAGEQAVSANCPQHFILRTSWLYSSFGSNFVKTILRLAETRDQLGIVYDQVGTPTYAADLAEAIIAIIESGNTSFGLYHYSNEGVASWYDFTIAIADLFGLSTEVLPILAVQYPLPAARPSFSVMNKAKIKEAFDLGIPHWRTSLIKCKERLLQQE